jgi:hypothetical protein
MSIAEIYLRWKNETKMKCRSRSPVVPSELIFLATAPPHNFPFLFFNLSFLILNQGNLSAYAAFQS